MGLDLSAPAGAAAAITLQASSDTSALRRLGTPPWVSRPDLTEPLSFSSPQPGHLASCAPCPAAHAGPSTPASPPAVPQALPSVSPGPPALPHGTACPSPISLALDSTAATQMDPRASSPGPCPSGSRRSRLAARSWGRFLRRGCWTSPTLATLSPRCPAVPHGKVQPLGGRERRLRPDTRTVSSFFQVKTAAPSDSRACPRGCGPGEDRHRRARKGSAKELICPWETPTEEGRAG
ncbi:regulator of G-protein signaling 9-like [Corvus hawaiiensis]|uniref:regulator of G-protein signaling 9-like n=1 Tax=Corvus hawaiiensis TaxID=134902 RepID=UPI002018DFC1|nr:regulator of G-protein signaling 9-like [Corvus hawaiiensis]